MNWSEVYKTERRTFREQSGSVKHDAGEHVVRIN